MTSSKSELFSEYLAMSKYSRIPETFYSYFLALFKRITKERSLTNEEEFKAILIDFAREVLGLSLSDLELEYAVTYALAITGTRGVEELETEIDRVQLEFELEFGIQLGSYPSTAQLSQGIAGLRQFIVERRPFMPVSEELMRAMSHFVEHFEGLRQKVANLRSMAEIWCDKAFLLELAIALSKATTSIEMEEPRVLSSHVRAMVEMFFADPVNCVRLENKYHLAK